MAYASITHVVMHHPARPTYTATTVPNASMVTLLLDESSAELDFALTVGGYLTPLSAAAPSSVKAFFQKAAAYGALAMIEAGAQVSHSQTTFAAAFASAKQMIQDGELPLVDRDDAQSAPRSGVDADFVGSGPLFTIDMKF